MSNDSFKRARDDIDNQVFKNYSDVCYNYNDRDDILTEAEGDTMDLDYDDIDELSKSISSTQINPSFKRARLASSRFIQFEFSDTFLIV